MIIQRQKYDKIARMAMDIYQDYNIRELPVDEKALCRAMGISLISYAQLPDKYLRLAYKRSEDGFCIPQSILNEPRILFNEKKSRERIRFTVFHEMKHILMGDTEETEENEALANFFAKNMICPIPYLIFRNIIDPFEIMSVCDCSYEVGVYVADNIQRRMDRYENQIFDYEKKVVEMLKY